MQNLVEIEVATIDACRALHHGCRRSPHETRSTEEDKTEARSEAVEYGCRRALSRARIGSREGLRAQREASSREAGQEPSGLRLPGRARSGQLEPHRKRASQQEIAVERESALDLATLLHVVIRSIDHAKAKQAIVTEYSQAVCRFVDGTFGVDLSIKVIGFGRDGY
jgi:hypothetical protein